MSNLLDKKTINNLKQKNIFNIKIFFYNAWCSWIKVDLEENPDILNLDLFLNQDWVNIYCEKSNKIKFENCKITKTIIADHTWKEKIRYIFTSKQVKDRCGCWSSFSFSKKKLKINFDKLKDLKLNFHK